MKSVDEMSSRELFDAYQRKQHQEQRPTSKPSHKGILKCDVYRYETYMMKIESYIPISIECAKKIAMKFCENPESLKIRTGTVFFKYGDKWESEDGKYSLDEWWAKEHLKIEKLSE